MSHYRFFFDELEAPRSDTVFRFRHAFVDQDGMHDNTRRTDPDAIRRLLSELELVEHQLADLELVIADVMCAVVLLRDRRDRLKRDIGATRP